jgi:serine/threonine protein kinase
VAKRKRIDDHMLLAPGERVRGLSGTYDVDTVIGNGAFGAVYSAEDPSKPGRHVALKEFFPPRHPREQTMLKDLWERERVVGVQASPHPLMPTFYEAFQFDGHRYIAMEFIEGQTLDEIVRKRSPLPREWTLKWTVSLCDALAFLHSRGIIHHDLKPANIRIGQQGHLTLLDFGASQYFGKQHANAKPIEMYGTEGYLPPELDADNKWVADVRTDIFALGCLIYELIAGESPDQEKINERSMYVTNELMQMPNADLNLVNLVHRALSYNTEYRFNSANELLLEVRKISPPVLLVNKKHIRFGDVTLGQHVPPLQLTVYNAGGGELRGEVKPRTPWVQVPVSTFKGNKRDINVIISTEKVPEREKPMIGKLEVNSPDILDEFGRIVWSGDRWFVDCTVTVVTRAGVLEVVERPTNNLPPLALRTRKGLPAIGSVHLKNVGERPTDYRIDIGGAGHVVSGVTTDFAIVPRTGTIPAGESVAIEVTIPTEKLVTGFHKATLEIKTSGSQLLNVPFVVQVQSQLDFLKSRILKT